MDKKKFFIFLALFSPLSYIFVAAGFLAMIMLIVKIDVLAIGCTVFWFYSAGFLFYFYTNKQAFKNLGFYRVFLFMLLMALALALLSTFALLVRP